MKLFVEGYHCLEIAVFIMKKRMNVVEFVKPYKKKELYLCSSAYDYFNG